ncbi:D-Ala-D-Ala carboxypeptidase family metallohydrolase [Luteimonas aquatica]|uniref:D-Ala-D-Ala carboxypeptidase family metallohydrolase n=1 Tax=Luteimonas aquatica TaxID=450364 RepID=UPI001F580D38|nr:D-Ala-D-Ala carboxypeptidase family metallohydrolase [Luteimonas aquatica]
MPLLLAACGAFSPSPAERYARWRESDAAAATDDYLAYLRQAGVADVLPPAQLLRSGRAWWRCGASEFAVPPRAAWPRMIPTLRLVRALRQQGLLDGAEVGSAYRGATLNRCEGGSTRSQHLRNAALDFDLPADPSRIARLCAHWRKAGASSGFGLGLYDNRHVHVDSAGYRTWGSDYRRRSSPCR